MIPKQPTNFGGGDVFSLAGAIALGYVHPISIILISIFAIGFSTSAVAGERQRGTLEVLLARPLSRTGLYVTLLAAALLFIALVLIAASIGTVVGSAVVGVLPDLPIARLPVLWLNGMLLWGGFAAIGLAASVSFDRLSPALGVTVAIVIVSYFLDILGSLWPDAKGLQQYSLFHYLDVAGRPDRQRRCRRVRAPGGRRRDGDRRGPGRVPAARSRRPELRWAGPIDPATDDAAPACSANGVPRIVGRSPR